MYRNNFLLLSCLTVFLVQACFEEDERAMPYPGKVSTITDSIQTNTSYFDLETGSIVKSHPNSAWQLGFECGTNGWHIITNSGARWFIYNTGQTVPDAVQIMPSKINDLYDRQCAFPDSTAVGNWVNVSESGNTYNRNIYLLGRLVEGDFIQVKQLAFLAVSDSSYRFFYKEQDSGISDTVVILKNDPVNFIYFSFEHHREMQLEADKTTYDLVFGSYYDLATLFGLTIPYQVGGAFLNLWQTEAALDSITGYSQIDAANLPGYYFTTRRDVPGYRWKGVSVDVSGGGTANYTVKSNYSYIIHTAEGNYYKLRFLSYSLDGSSGFPQFEYRQLE